MKKIVLAISLILALSVFPAMSQDIKADGVVVIPSHIADSVILDLEEKDRLLVELRKRDSVLTVYELELGSRKQIIKEVQLTADEYKVLVKKLEDEMDMMASNQSNERKQYRRQVTRLKIENFGLKALAVIELVLLAFLII